ncbi:MAG: hypothetical protein AAF243_06195 [Cyanobacteria bacterium P01_A01_bin.137]
MRFGAMCFLGLYVGIALFNWVSGLHWLAEFSLPLSLLGGFGLAIASTPVKPSTITAKSKSTASTSNVSPSDASEKKPEKSDSPDIAPAPHASNQASQPAESSISFTINKNVRP